MNPKKLLGRLRDYRRKKRELNDPLNNLIDSIENYVSSMESKDKKSIENIKDITLKILKNLK